MLQVPNDYISVLEIIKLQKTDRQRGTGQTGDRKKEMLSKKDIKSREI